MRDLRIKIVAALGATLLLTSLAAPAFASQITQYYNLNMPALQGGVRTGVDTKTITAAPGWISMYFVGSSYKANVVMCSTSFYCGGGTKVHDIDDNQTASLPNSYGKTCKCTLEMTTSSQAVVSVQVIGYWASF